MLPPGFSLLDPSRGWWALALAPSGRELDARKGSLRELAGGGLTIGTQHRPIPDVPAALVHAAHCVKALCPLQQSPSVMATPCHLPP